MNTKDINFASEYLFNVEIEKPIIDFKENNLYKYQFALDVLSIGQELKRTVFLVKARQYFCLQ